MRAKDIMTSPVYTATENTPVETAAGLMTANAVTALPVVDATNNLVGMVSESDLLWHRVPSDPTTHARRLPDTDPANRPDRVGEVMSPYPVTTQPEADVAEVAELMLDHDVRSVPVLQDRTVVGIISRRDILRAMVRTDDVLTGEIQHRLDEFADRPHRWMVTVERGVARVIGDFDNESEQAIVAVLARTVPGVAAVDVGSVRPAQKGR
jgi:CBS domain-containing protein